MVSVTCLPSRVCTRTLPASAASTVPRIRTGGGELCAAASIGKAIARATVDISNVVRRDMVCFHEEGSSQSSTVAIYARNLPARLISEIAQAQHILHFGHGLRRHFARLFGTLFQHLHDLRPVLRE